MGIAGCFAFVRLDGGWRGAATGRWLERFEAVAEFAGEGFQGGGWNFTQGAAEKLLFQGGQSSGEGGDFVGDTWKGRPAVVWLWRGKLELAVPFYDGGFGEAEPAADAGQAKALDAKAEEFVASILWIHGQNGLNR
jgi:hypothetical protein